MSTLARVLPPIAAALDDGWSAVSGHGGGWDHDAFLIGPNGVELRVTVGEPWRHGERGRLRFLAALPHGTDRRYGVPSPQAWISAGKGAAQVARELRRRLLPAAEVWMADALGRAAERDRVEQRRAALVADARAALGPLGGTWDAQGERVMFGGYSMLFTDRAGVNGYVHVPLREDCSARLHVEIPRGRLVEVAAFIAQLDTGQYLRN